MEIPLSTNMLLNGGRGSTAAINLPAKTKSIIRTKIGAMNQQYSKHLFHQNMQLPGLISTKLFTLEWIAGAPRRQSICLE